MIPFETSAQQGKINGWIQHVWVKEVTAGRLELFVYGLGYLILLFRDEALAVTPRKRWRSLPTSVYITLLEKWAS